MGMKEIQCFKKLNNSTPDEVFIESTPSKETSCHASSFAQVRKLEHVFLADQSFQRNPTIFVYYLVLGVNFLPYGKRCDDKREVHGEPMMYGHTTSA